MITYTIYNPIILNNTILDGIKNILNHTFSNKRASVEHFRNSLLIKTSHMNDFEILLNPGTHIIKEDKLRLNNNFDIVKLQKYNNSSLEATVLYSILYFLNSSTGSSIYVDVNFSSSTTPNIKNFGDNISFTDTILEKLFKVNLIPIKTLDMPSTYKGESKYTLIPSNLYKNICDYNWINFNIDFSQFKFSLSEVHTFASNNPDCFCKPLNNSLYTIYNLTSNDISICLSMDNQYKQLKEHTLHSSNILRDEEVFVMNNLLSAQKNAFISNLVTHFNTKYSALNISSLDVTDAMSNTEFSYKAVLNIIFQITKWNNLDEQCPLNIKEDSIAKIRHLIKHGFVSRLNSKKKECTTLKFNNMFNYILKDDSNYLIDATNQNHIHLLRILNFFETGEFSCNLHLNEIKESDLPVKQFYTKIFSSLKKDDFVKPFNSIKLKYIESLSLSLDNALIIEFKEHNILLEFLEFIFNYSKIGEKI